MSFILLLITAVCFAGSILNHYAGNQALYNSESKDIPAMHFAAAEVSFFTGLIAFAVWFILIVHIYAQKVAL